MTIQASRHTSERDPEAVIRTLVRARISTVPEWDRSEGGVGVCRLTVIGDAAGPASRPPRVTLYIKDGGCPEEGYMLQPDESRRCAFNLGVGDLIQAVGNLGPERDKVDRQEVIVTEPVKLKLRAAEAVAA
jgi:hypothetical protein